MANIRNQHKLSQFCDLYLSWWFSHYYSCSQILEDGERQEKRSHKEHSRKTMLCSGSRRRKNQEEKAKSKRKCGYCKGEGHM